MICGCQQNKETIYTEPKNKEFLGYTYDDFLEYLKTSNMSIEDFVQKAVKESETKRDSRNWQ